MELEAVFLLFAGDGKLLSVELLVKIYFKELYRVSILRV
jgi:hypothetical protein